MDRTIFDITIGDLTEIGEIYEFLIENFASKKLMAKMTLNNITQPPISLTSRNEVMRLYTYLSAKWTEGCLHIVVLEE